MPNRSSADEKVGYRKPPKHAQFRKGRSGNPAGRPRRRKKKIADLLATVSAEELTIPTKTGKKRKMSKQEVAIRQLVTKALNKDFKAIKLVLKQAAKIPELEDVPQIKVIQINIVKPKPWKWDEEETEEL